MTFFHTEEGTTKPIIAKTTETEADADGIVTVFLNDLVPGQQCHVEVHHDEEDDEDEMVSMVGHGQQLTGISVQASSNDDGVDELLTSINR